MERFHFLLVYPSLAVWLFVLALPLLFTPCDPKDQILDSISYLAADLSFWMGQEDFGRLAIS